MSIMTNNVIANSKPTGVKLDESVLYHGSSKNIKGGYLLPKNNSQEDDDYVFCTTDKNFALCYAGNIWHDGIMKQGYYNNQLYLVEMKKGIFDKVLNRPGYIYHIKKDKNFFQRGMKIEWLSKEKAKIVDVEKIDNVLDAIKESNIDLYYYPKKPKWWRNAKFIKNLQ